MCRMQRNGCRNGKRQKRGLSGKGAVTTIRPFAVSIPGCAFPCIGKCLPGPRPLNPGAGVTPPGDDSFAPGMSVTGPGHTAAQALSLIHI